MKKYISGLLTGIIIATSLTTFAAVQLKVVPNPYPIFINNSKANVQGYNINGSTYLKLSDLKVAGIDAKFDKKQITINKASAEVDTTKVTTDSLKIYIFDSKNYVCASEIYNKYPQYTFGIPKGKTWADKILAFKNKLEEKDLISDVPYTIVNGITYISSDYYEKNILNIIKAEEK